MTWHARTVRWSCAEIQQEEGNVRVRTIGFASKECRRVSNQLAEDAGKAINIVVHIATFQCLLGNTIE